MNRTKVMTFISFGAVAIIIAIVFSLTLTNAQTEHEHNEQMLKMRIVYDQRGDRQHQQDNQKKNNRSIAVVHEPFPLPVDSAIIFPL